MDRIVLDSSAALAHILREPGGERVRDLLAAGEVPIFMSAVNWSETLTRTQRESSIMDGRRLAAMLPGVEVVPFDLPCAEAAAGYAKASPFLSLGDRACLALARAQNATAWTADRIWAALSIDVAIELIRQPK